MQYFKFYYNMYKFIDLSSVITSVNQGVFFFEQNIFLDKLIYFEIHILSYYVNLL